MVMLELLCRAIIGIDYLSDRTADSLQSKRAKVEHADVLDSRRNFANSRFY